MRRKAPGMTARRPFCADAIGIRELFSRSSRFFELSCRYQELREVPTLHVFDPKRLMYRSQVGVGHLPSISWKAKKFVTAGSLFTLICLAGLIYGRLSMRRGQNHGHSEAERALQGLRRSLEA